MIVRTREMSIISANIFDFTARKFFVDLYRSHDKQLRKHTIVFTLVTTYSEKRVAPVVGFCSCSVFCCALLCVHSGFAIILFGREEPLAVPCVYLQFVIEVVPGHTHLLY